LYNATNIFALPGKIRIFLAFYGSYSCLFGREFPQWTILLAIDSSKWSFTDEIKEGKFNGFILRMNVSNEKSQTIEASDSRLTSGRTL